MYVYIYTCVYTYLYVYIYRERDACERERGGERARETSGFHNPYKGQSGTTATRACSSPRTRPSVDMRTRPMYIER